MSSLSRNIRNFNIHKEFKALQAKGMKVKPILEILSEKFWISPHRIRDIVYKSKVKREYLSLTEKDFKKFEQMK